ncbi:MAG: tRNA (adenosine(37)-N6)-threonylcarbamoyltransferase complex ATPase subunit type 1 TsaE, partial [Alphaproteobacteria bacterium]|nr:tRNA (adenosine(37)-N6)-threonylcarbamoyltransferase complex ATPase subunit type 1 TsaE [Alphaproteobacteria bacterium]
LEDPSELEELGWRETVDGLALIEWPDRAGPFLPAWRLDIVFDMDNDSRSAALVPHGEDWQARLHDL